MRCLIVDDSPSFGAAARRLLENEGIAVVGVTSTLAEARVCFEELRPDFALVDVNLGAESGFELAQQLHRDGWLARSSVILISTHAEQDLAEMVADSPAVGFLSKSVLTPGAIRDLLGGRDDVDRAAWVSGP